MNKKAALAAELSANTGKFEGDLNRAKGQAKQFVSDINAMKGGGGFLTSMKEGVGNVIGKYQHLRGAVTDVAAAALAVAAAPAAYADMTDALTAVTGSAKEAATAMDFLAGVAEEQALLFEPLVEAYSRMRALGYSAEQTRDFIREMGNAIESSGGSADDLSTVTAALSKITAEGRVTIETIEAMGESLPLLRKIFSEQLGTKTSAEIQALNLSSQQLFDTLMTGLRAVETSKADELDAFDPAYLASQTRLRLGRSELEANKQSELAKMGVVPNPLEIAKKALIPDLPERQQQEQDLVALAEKRKKIQEEAAAAHIAGVKDAFDEEQRILNLQQKIKEAQVDGDDEHVAALEDEVSLLTEAKKLAKEANIEQDLANKLILQRNEARREGERMIAAAAAVKEQQQNDAEGSKTAYSTAEDIAILEARGNKRRKLEEKKQLREKTEQLVAGGVDPRSAEQLAARAQRAEKDAEYRERTGRSRLRGAESANNPVRLGAGVGVEGGFSSESKLATDKAPPASSDPVLRVLEEISRKLSESRTPDGIRAKSR